MLKISPIELNRAHQACKIIEVDGSDGFIYCIEQYGKDVAVMLLVMFLRSCKGSMDSYPPEGGFQRLIDDVNEILKKDNII